MRGKTGTKHTKCPVVFAALAAMILLWAGRAPAQPVIAAYQKIYAMNFEVWRPEGLPPGWHVTFDGYPVAQVSANHWVYGRPEREGVIVPTAVAVGSVVPMDVPELARVTVSRWRGGVGDTREFRSIARMDFDNMGVLGDPLAYTPVAWKTGRAKLLLWLGDRWYSVIPNAGQSASDALMARHSFIVRTLAKKNAVWTRSDTAELADLSREWGYIWRGTLPFASFAVYRQGGGNGDGSLTGPGAGSPGGGLPEGSSPATGGGQWDVGGGDGGSSGGGGGWDTGSGSGNTGGGSGGWDSGAGGGGNSGNGGNDGGWDK
ncbi:MAG: hypothetical protein LBQ90_08315 [Synergistaceae bacterium]|nr:hypothetical protein [Synergistaceae bacterium]